MIALEFQDVSGSFRFLGSHSSASVTILKGKHTLPSEIPSADKANASHFGEFPS